MDRIKVTVFSPREDSRRTRLLGALSELYPVAFFEKATLDQMQGDAALLFGVSRADAIRVARSGLPCLAFIDAQSAPARVAMAGIQFTEAAYLPACFRGRTLSDEVANPLSRLILEPGDQVLARKGEEILWIHRKEGTTNLDLAAMEPAGVAEGGHLFQNFLAGRWSRLLPMLHFLRKVTDGTGWELPPLRACFMFDDPNLHALSYGYVNYPSLARGAEVHRYHVSFATVPFDGWYVNRKAATLFREKAKYLSLLVHGNNHTTRELAQVRTEEQRRVLATQSLARIERLERVSGLEIPRVMAAPHGACRGEMAASLLQAGYEAACISRSAIMNHNRQQVWPLTVGMNPAEFLGGGLPVIPRFGMTKECQAEVLLATFLGQAIVPMGHHGDLAGGLDVLRDLAAVINDMGDVQWVDLKSIARSNYCTRRETEVLRVKMYSRRIHVRVPEGIDQISVERPWLTSARKEPLTWREGLAGPVHILESDQEEIIRVMPGTNVDIASLCLDAIDPGSVSFPRTALAAIGRRYLCEARDRLQPLLHRLMAPGKVNGVA